MGLVLQQCRLKYLVVDELYYFLPIARAKEAIENKNPEGAIKQLATVEKYIANHPKRFAYLKEISIIRESAKYLTKALTMLKKNDMRRGLDYVKYFLVENYAETGELPDSRYALSSLLEREFGHRLSNQYELEEYEPKEDSFTIVFRRISNNSRVTISQRF